MSGHEGNGEDRDPWDEQTAAQVEDRWLSHLITKAVREHSSQPIRRLSNFVLLGLMAVAVAIGALAWSIR